MSDDETRDSVVVDGKPLPTWLLERDTWQPGAATLIDSEMAAVLLGVSVRRVRQMVDEGKVTNEGTARQFAFDIDAISRHAAQKQRRDLTN